MSSLIQTRKDSERVIRQRRKLLSDLRGHTLKEVHYELHTLRKEGERGNKHIPMPQILVAKATSGLNWASICLGVSHDILLSRIKPSVIAVLHRC